MIGFAKITIRQGRLADLMYGLIMTNSQLVGTFHMGLQKYTRRQNAGSTVYIRVDIDERKVEMFEALTGIKLVTSDEFQGIMTVNKQKTL